MENQPPITVTDYIFTTYKPNSQILLTVEQLHQDLLQAGFKISQNPDALIKTLENTSSVIIKGGYIHFNLLKCEICPKQLHCANNGCNGVHIVHFTMINSHFLNSFNHNKIKQLELAWTLTTYDPASYLLTAVISVFGDKICPNQKCKVYDLKQHYSKLLNQNKSIVGDIKIDRNDLCKIIRKYCNYGKLLDNEDMFLITSTRQQIVANICNKSKHGECPYRDIRPFDVGCNKMHIPQSYIQHDEEGINYNRSPRQHSHRTIHITNNDNSIPDTPKLDTMLYYNADFPDKDDVCFKIREGKVIKFKDESIIFINPFRSKSDIINKIHKHHVRLNGLAIRQLIDIVKKNDDISLRFEVCPDVKRFILLSITFSTYALHHVFKDWRNKND